jgi:membrane peptidoglycan carboxypeptidase
LLDLYEKVGLYDAPDLRLPTSSSTPPSPFQEPQRAYLGESALGVSPLQMALAAATLSNGGILPAPQIAVAVDTAPGQWTVLPPLGESKQVLPKNAADAVATSLAVNGLPVWQSTGRALNGTNTVTWYQAGTLPTWNGAPLALIVLLEEDNPEVAVVIGQAMIQAALQSP